MPRRLRNGIPALLLEELLIHLLELERLPDRCAHVVPHHELGQLRPVDENEAHRNAFGELPSAGAKAPSRHEHTSACLSTLESADERLNFRTIDCRLPVITLGLYADEF
jgi:hypothetical protein